MHEVREHRPHIARPETGLVSAAQNGVSQATLFQAMADSNAKRLEEFKRKLGARLLTHPDYKPDPRHSLRAEIWTKAPAPWWARVSELALQARLANPQFQRAQTIQNNQLTTN